MLFHRHDRFTKMATKTTTKTTMIQKKTWGIIGLGWLGQSLFDRLKLNGNLVWGTHRRDFTFGVDPFPDQLCDVLFLNTPPLLNIPARTFVDEISNSTAGHKNLKIIFVSSTSVFGDHQGTCTEETRPEPITKNGQWLVEVEGLLTQKLKDQLVIIRPAGLIGEDRHPVYFFSKNQNHPGGRNPVNLVHKEDLLNVILEIERSNFKGLVNAVSEFHPQKSIYYNFWANKFNLDPIQFLDELSSSKQVDSVVLPQIYTKWKFKDLGYSSLLWI